MKSRKMNNYVNCRMLENMQFSLLLREKKRSIESITSWSFFREEFNSSADGLGRLNLYPEWLPSRMGESIIRITDNSLTKKALVIGATWQNVVLAHGQNVSSGVPLKIVLHLGGRFYLINLHNLKKHSKYIFFIHVSSHSIRKSICFGMRQGK